MGSMPASPGIASRLTGAMLERGKQMTDMYMLVIDLVLRSLQVCATSTEGTVQRCLNAARNQTGPLSTPL